MNRNGLISKVTELLEQRDIRKRVPAKKTTLHITDDEGNHSNFIVRKTERGYLYNSNDISAILEAIIDVVEDTVKQGEEVSIQGFGSLALYYKAKRQVSHPKTGELCTVDAHYVPKFVAGKNLQIAAKVFDGRESDFTPDTACSCKECEEDGEN